MKKIHFLHIPKTAGQSVHQLLVTSFASVSPLRLNTQYQEFGKDSVSKFEVISGHIDWSLMNEGGDAEFTFTVLRKPIDRILSFYHYLRSEAKKLDDSELSKPERIGMFNALNLSPDDYFCSQDIIFKKFIDNHYDNFYAYYFSALCYDGNSLFKNKLNQNEILGLAIKNLSKVDKIYTLSNLSKLPSDLKDSFPDNIFSSLKHVNKGDSLTTEERLYRLHKIGESHKAISKIRDMCVLDDVIFDLICKS
jgi:hypothetical protein